LNNLARKLYGLEQNALGDVPAEGTTRITWENGNKGLDMAENILMDEFRNIVDRLAENTKELADDPNVGIEDLTPNEKAICDLGEKRMFLRMHDIVNRYFDLLVYHGDNYAKYIFNLRLLWIIEETQKQAENTKIEEEITDTPGYWEMCEGDQDKIQAKANAKMHNEGLFTPKSFSDYIEKKHFFKTTEELKEMIANRTPEQIAQDDIEVKAEEEENAKWIAQDAKFLKEKCPTCPSKCAWYKEQQQEVKA
jgi:hypothetical protein